MRTVIDVWINGVRCEGRVRSLCPNPAAVRGGRARGDVRIMAGNAGGGGSGFEMSLDVLETFERSLEGLMKELGEGPDPVAKSTELALNGADLGVDFHESAWMGTVLQETSARVQQLIGVLQDQIAAMKMSVRTAGGTTAAIDEDQRRELNAIMTRLRENTTRPPAAGTGSGGGPSSKVVDLG
ncbi:hypothetical protein [Streptomyces sp. SID3343]|uniref:hypothetical protein n=1 Tax=Streptomyces sp. SID3343 TaxID=2690260 RepID=UPI0013691C4B|nr:hypothetical protein [Streptomyces sp. SID3343]MYV96900.1 hypothetical protein [Streptomyces sp. SID3343]